MSVNALYELWLSKVTDAELLAELKAAAGNAEEINDRFFQTLAFGTGGLRGIMGAGTNRMNIYTVGSATQGLANYLNKSFAGRDKISVAIGHDSRNNSRLFAEISADIFKNQANVALQYGITEGYAPLRTAVEARMKEKFGIGRDFDTTIITTGGQQGLELACDLGCRVLAGDSIAYENNIDSTKEYMKMPPQRSFSVCPAVPEGYCRCIYSAENVLPLPRSSWHWF